MADVSADVVIGQLLAVLREAFLIVSGLRMRQASVTVAYSL